MTLTQQLKDLAEGSKLRHPGIAQETMQSAIDELVQSSILDKATKKGAKIPEISLPNATGKTVNLSEVLKDNRVVLTFYRGGWCPYCNLELKAFQNALPEIEAKGAKLIAISPETPDNSLSTAEKNELSFEVLSDTNNKTAKDLGLVFQLPETLQNLYKKFGIDLDTNQNNTNQELPIAATYIIEQDGTISYDYLQEDYKLRADPSEVLTAL
ncbi:peroxiredoxin-like family protein [Winogradskyella immobilis]|uniref:thioredoxin-dependent peroxiredoxin n=1 Tax=Winogradskyella immobilis TaxID=2816852 RepID=A0ABS8EPD3_9FLAO|nr:peroxiredoxin-like family protein [Winogradskyella immobilis]MCC1485078.1 AhpC/TSA family protein [Winogradskyella immobilis]MCG0017170.1 AhpC/TSA family protein [Winogradskyella immobilis]